MKNPKHCGILAQISWNLPDLRFGQNIIMLDMGNHLQHYIHIGKQGKIITTKRTLLDNQEKKTLFCGRQPSSFFPIIWGQLYRFSFTKNIEHIENKYHEKLKKSDYTTFGCLWMNLSVASRSRELSIPALEKMRRASPFLCSNKAFIKCSVSTI